MALIPENLDRTFRFVVWVLGLVVAATGTVATFQVTTTTRLENISARVVGLEAHIAKLETSGGSTNKDLIEIGKTLARIEERQKTLEGSVNDIKLTIRDMKAR